MVRLFVAIDLPPEIREQIKDSQQELKKSRARLSLVNPEIIHITMKFIGEVEKDAVESIKKKLDNILDSPFEVQVTGISADNPRRPRVVWCTIDDQGRCAQLHERIEDALFPLGIKKEGRKFRPHATVARVKRFDSTLIESIRPLVSVPYGNFIINGFTLKKSTLTPTGPIYEDIMEVRW
ncbi:MAG TPA: RNA 2',3'-cyclic phosphodiesterase [Methanoregulaceae archaeon]|nr:RNA 2',3'-cyclic phosphodiesterase [Methanoregulaceae archaeon]